MKYKSKLVDGVEVIYSSDWIHRLESEEHFNWYYHQAKLVYGHCARADQILEIGVGAHLLADLLRRRGWSITTLDIDEDKHPDICMSAIEFDYSKFPIDVVLAFEIFEHIPFTTFETLVGVLARARIKRIFFSLPWNERRLVDFQLSMPLIPNLAFRIPLGKNKITTKAHFWELAKRDKDLDQKKLVTLENITRLFKDNGYELNRLNKVKYIEYFDASLVS